MLMERQQLYAVYISDSKTTEWYYSQVCKQK